MPPAKRQCFSVESLAVSSRAESEETSSRDRDTDSPYVHYIQKTEPEVNNNNNVMQYLYNNQYYNMNSYMDAARTINTQHMAYPSINTSTPITVSSKRRRLCSGSSSTSPTSSEDERFVTDMSVTSESAEYEKLSSSSSTTSSVISDPDVDPYQDDSLSKRKKARTAFTADQLRSLEKSYKTHKYLSASDRSQIARSLKLKDQQVKTWFQNRRMKEKRQQKEEDRSNCFSLPTGGVDVAQLAALGICPPPPYGRLSGPTNPYTHTTIPNTDPAVSPPAKPEPSSPVYKSPATNPTITAQNAFYAERLASLMQQSPFLTQQMALSPAGTQHPLLQFGYSSQFSPSMQVVKRS